MQKRLVILAIWSILLIAEVAPTCDYFDTVDLTNSEQLENGSYLYEGTLIPKENVRNYSKQYFFDGEEDVPEHPRGCVCQNKPCIRLCCELGQKLADNERKCVKASNEYKSETVVSIMLRNGKEETRNIKEFTLLTHLPIPCKHHLQFNSEGIHELSWTLFENGQLLRHLDSVNLSKREYCMQPEQTKGATIYKMVPHQCAPSNMINDILQFMSVFSMILIIIVYQILPNFRTFVHGKCCTCYFFCLSLSYSLVIVGSLRWVEPTEDNWSCYLVGGMGYCAVISSFLWLLIINYNLWNTFKNVCVVGVENRFKKYNIFVWSMVTILFAITALAEATPFWIPELEKFNDLTPGFALLDCWINTYRWSASIYYYGPMLTLILINIVLFIKTARRIIVQNRDNWRQLRRSQCQCQLRNLTNFLMLFRLFVIVGVMWILEVISYICILNNVFNKWILVLDCITSSQGIILFVITILKRDVLTDLYKRFKWKPQRQSTLTSDLVYYKNDDVK